MFASSPASRVDSMSDGRPKEKFDSHLRSILSALTISSESALARSGSISRDSAHSMHDDRIKSGRRLHCTACDADLSKVAPIQTRAPYSTILLLFKRTNERSNERTIERSNDRTNERTNERMNERMNERTNERTNE